MVVFYSWMKSGERYFGQNQQIFRRLKEEKRDTVRDQDRNPHNQILKIQIETPRLLFLQPDQRLHLCLLVRRLHHCFHKIPNAQSIGVGLNFALHDMWDLRNLVIGDLVVEEWSETTTLKFLKLFNKGSEGTKQARELTEAEIDCQNCTLVLIFKAEIDCLIF